MLSPLYACIHTYVCQQVKGSTDLFNHVNNKNCRYWTSRSRAQKKLLPWHPGWKTNLNLGDNFVLKQLKNTLTDRQKDRKTDQHSDVPTDTQKNSYTARHTDTQKHRQIKIRSKTDRNIDKQAFLLSKIDIHTFGDKTLLIFRNPVQKKENGK